MTSERIDVLVLGLGNLLCSDDGAGVAVVQALASSWGAPKGVRVVDGGTLGMDLIAIVAASDRVIVVDAIAGDGPPGTLVRLAGEEVPRAVQTRLSAHQVGVADLLAGVAWLDEMPREVVIVGVVPASTDVGYGCTPAVAASLPALVDAVIDEVARCRA
ncbi:MAG TPA: HyaD/HybD family hydrogenase maturation endopeptidase [Kofleriaceae bacterium]|nr:HyaD/HybD family hydrogenase maturation endopeptidase [Kofleriaceae bacterium]